MLQNVSFINTNRYTYIDLEATTWNKLSHHAGQWCRVVRQESSPHTQAVPWSARVHAA